MQQLTIRTEGDRAIVMTRAFDAPRDLVFRALTEPELVMRWLGPRAWPLIEAEIDLSIGGAYRFVARGPDGTRMRWGGVYEAIERPDRLVHTARKIAAWRDSIGTDIPLPPPHRQHLATTAT